MEGIVYVHSPKDPSSPIFIFKGHTENVCCLYASFESDSGLEVISGSWDKTARVWRNGNFEYDLQGHSQAVWGLTKLSDGGILSGSSSFNNI